MNYRPLSAHGKPDPRFDTLHEGLPFWMHRDLSAWFQTFLGAPLTPTRIRRVDLLHKRMRLEVTASSGFMAKETALTMAFVDETRAEFALDLIDYALHFLSEWGSSAEVDRLNQILTEGDSAWQVSPVEDGAGSFTLTRRESGPLRDAIDALAPGAGRAGVYLTSAWGYLAGRDRLPDQAYFQAVQAVEAAAKPVFSPDDSSATLGKMITVLRDAPQKFTFILGDPDAVRPLMEALWRTHRRHGTDDDAMPDGMTQEEADAAVHLALTLVRWFSSGGFARASYSAAAAGVTDASAAASSSTPT